MPDLVSQTLLRRYFIEDILGHGGMSDVYLAFDQRRSVQVAIKVLRDDLADDIEFVRRFKNEAHALGRLNHPNIVHCYGFEQQGHFCFMVMDYIDGVTLRHYLSDSDGPLPTDQINSIMRQVGAALQYAHSEKIVHRDIKPGNIMLRKDGGVLLTDFGIAKALESATASTMGLGAPAYMSPEQIRGQAVDLRSDIYSLGVMLYEMAAGRRPFVGATGTGETTMERIKFEQLHAQPPDPRLYNSKLTDQAVDVILRALNKNREQRWPGMLEFVQAWEEAVGATAAPDLVKWPGADYQRPSPRRIAPTPPPAMNAPANINPRTIIKSLTAHQTPGRPLPRGLIIAGAIMFIELTIFLIAMLIFRF